MDLTKIEACMEYLKFIPIEDSGITQVVQDIISHVGCSEATGWRALGRLKMYRNEIRRVDSKVESTVIELSFLYQLLLEMIKKFKKMKVNYPFLPEQLGRIKLIEELLEGWTNGKDL